MSPSRILVVEDDSTWREGIFREELVRAGYEVVTAPGYDEAVRVFRPHYFALAIVDIVLGDNPERDAHGRKLLARLHNEDPELPTLAISFHWSAHPSWMREALVSHGVRDALEKQNFDLANFLALARQYIRSTNPMNDYFLGHRLTSAEMEDLRISVTNAFGQYGLRARAVDQSGVPDFLLNTAKDMINHSRFSVFDLSEPRPNLFIEIGIAMGYNRPVLLLARHGTCLPEVLCSFLTIEYRTYPHLKDELTSPTLQDWIDRAVERRPRDEMCWTTGGADLPETAFPPGSYLLCDGGDGLATFFRAAVSAALEPGGWGPVWPKSSAGPGFLICERCRQVRGATFGIYRISPQTSAEDYVALGLAIGLGAKFILATEKGVDPPSVLAGLKRFEYVSSGDIESRLPGVVRALLAQEN